MKLLHICYNLFDGTEMLSLSVYDPIAIQILLGGRRTVPQFGRGVELGVGCGTPYHTGHNVLIETDTLSLFV